MSIGPEPHPDALTELVRILREQLNHKDERIAALEARLDEANRCVTEQQRLMAGFLDRSITALALPGVASALTSSLATPAPRATTNAIRSPAGAPERQAPAQDTPVPDSEPPEPVIRADAQPSIESTALSAAPTPVTVESREASDAPVAPAESVEMPSPLQTVQVSPINDDQFILPHYEEQTSPNATENAPDEPGGAPEHSDQHPVEAGASGPPMSQARDGAVAHSDPVGDDEPRLGDVPKVSDSPAPVGARKRRGVSRGLARPASRVPDGQTVASPEIDHATALVFATSARPLPLSADTPDDHEDVRDSGQISDVVETNSLGSDGASRMPAIEDQDSFEITARLDRKELEEGHQALAAVNVRSRRSFWPWRARTGKS